MPGTQVAGDQFREHVAKVGGDRKVSALVELLVLETRPVTENVTPVHGAAQCQYTVGVLMIRAAGAVLGNRAPELGHGQDYDVLRAIPQVIVQGTKPAAEFTQTSGELPARATLPHVRIPASEVGERDLYTYVGLNELGNFPERSAEITLRIFGTASWLVATRIDGLQDAHRLEGLVSGSGDGVSVASAVETSEGGSHLILPPDAELFQVGNR
jgi:hypothetical protein